jgi:hypothetical protein
VLLCQVFDYNTLESAFLISATFMLLGGLIFKSVSDEKGTPAYLFLTIFVALLFLFSLFLFFGLLSFEMFQALKFAHILQYVRLHRWLTLCLCVCVHACVVPGTLLLLSFSIQWSERDCACRNVSIDLRACAADPSVLTIPRGFAHVSLTG